MPEVVYVKPGFDSQTRVDGRWEKGESLDEVNRAALADYDNAYMEVDPDLETPGILIVGDKKNPGAVHRVARTPAVHEAITSGRLIETDEDEWYANPAKHRNPLAKRPVKPVVELDTKPEPKSKSKAE